MPDGWFATGDGGYLDGAYLVIADRKKDVIITGGENVSSIEVEDCIYQHPGVAEVAVIGVPHDKWGETVMALVVLREGQSATRGAHRLLSREDVALQVPDHGRGARGPGAYRHRKAAEIQAQGALLAGPGAQGQLTKQKSVIRTDPVRLETAAFPSIARSTTP